MVRGLKSLSNESLKLSGGHCHDQICFRINSATLKNRLGARGQDSSKETSRKKLHSRDK